MPAQQMEINEAMARTLPPEIFVNTQAMLCGEGTECPLFTPSGELITFDGVHLTQAGARYLGSLVFRDPRLASYAPAAQVGAASPAAVQRAAPALEEAGR